MMESQVRTKATRMPGRKIWWILPIAVLFLLIGIIYLLGHMSSADSEMYPTTQRLQTPNIVHIC